MSIKMMTKVWDTATVSGSDLVVLLALADYSDDNGENIYPAMPTIAKKARLSVDQARRVVKMLIAENILELVQAGGWDGKRNRSNEYKILLSEGGTRVGTGTRADAGGVLAPMQGGGYSRRCKYSPRADASRSVIRTTILINHHRTYRSSTWRC